MLNEMLGGCGPCPVCGRYYHCGGDPWWWCPYCGPNLSQTVYKKVEKLSTRIDIIEAFIKWNEIKDLEE